jgi:hypothetical protein
MLLAVLSREFVSIINEELGVEKLDLTTDIQIRDLNYFFWLWNRVLRSYQPVAAFEQPATSEENGKVITATVQWILLAKLYGLVCQKEKYYEWPPLILRRAHIIQNRKEAANLSIILQKVLHVCIDVTTTQHHFSV